MKRGTNKMNHWKKFLAWLVALALMISFSAGFAEAKTLVLPATLGSIEEEAFYGLKSISKVILPEGLWEIGSKAFAYSSLTEIYLPETIDYIAENAFTGSKLSRVTSIAGSYAYNWAVNHGYTVVSLSPVIQSVTTSNGTTATVTWSSAENAVGYIVECSTNNFADESYISIYTYELEHTFGGLKPSTKYYFRVYADNGETGNIYSSEVVTKTTGTITTQILIENLSIYGESGDSVWMGNGCIGRIDEDTKNSIVFEPISATNQQLNWTSSNTKVATVIKTTGVITGVSTGVTTITATATDGSGVFISGNYYVGPKPPTKVNATVNGTTITVTWNAAEIATSYEVYAYAPEIDDYVVVDAITGTRKYVFRNLASNTEYYVGVRACVDLAEYDMSVSGDNSEEVSVITGTSTEAVPVREIQFDEWYVELQPGEPYSAAQHAIVLPTYANNRSVTWKSDNTSVAKVSSTGVVTAVAGGLATITATAKDGSGVVGSFEVVVIPDPPLIASMDVIDGTSIFLSWSAVQNATGYSVCYSTSEFTRDDIYNGRFDDYLAEYTEDTEYVVSGLEENTTYYVLIMAYVDDIEMLLSDTEEITTGEQVVLAESITLNVHEVTLCVGGTVDITATIRPKNVSLNVYSYTLSPSGIVQKTAGNKTITALKEGTVVFTVTTKDGTNLSDSCVITVLPNEVPATGVALNKTSLTMDVGDTETLTATVSPSNATNGTVYWTSSDESVVLVEDGTVTAVKAGAATITASTDNGITAECTVTINNVLATSLALDKTSVTINVGDTATIISTLLPSNVTEKNLNYSRSNTAIFKVNKATTSGNKGTFIVEGVAAGTATLTVKTKDGSNKSAVCTITVVDDAVTASLNKTSLTMNVGDTETLTATVTPSSTSPTHSPVWSSSNTSVATVSSSGVVTAVGAGTATVTYTYLYSGGSAQATCTVKVVSSITRTGSFSPSTLTVTQGSTSTVKISGSVTGSTLAAVTVNGKKPDGSDMSSIYTNSSWGSQTSFSNVSVTIDASSSGAFYTPGTYTLNLWVRDKDTASLTTPQATMTVEVVGSNPQQFITITGGDVVGNNDTKPTSTVDGGTIYDQTQYVLRPNQTITHNFSTDTDATVVTAKLRYLSNGIWYTYEDNDKEVANSTYYFTTQNGQKTGSIDLTIPPDITTGTYMLQVWSKNSAGTAVSVRMKIYVRGTNEQYNPDAAVAYARKYTDNKGPYSEYTGGYTKYIENYNKDYDNFVLKGGDCVNFVSQCLVEGGIEKDKDVWYYNDGNDYSESWTYVPTFVEWASKKWTIKSRIEADERIGDIVVYGDYHVAIITNIDKNGNVYVCGHTSNRKDFWDNTYDKVIYISER